MYSSWGGGKLKYNFKRGCNRVQRNCRRDVGGWVRDPKKQKESCTTILKRQKQTVVTCKNIGLIKSIGSSRILCSSI